MPLLFSLASRKHCTPEPPQLTHSTCLPGFELLDQKTVAPFGLFKLAVSCELRIVSEAHVCAIHQALKCLDS